MDSASEYRNLACFQGVEDALLECEGELNTLRQRAEDVTAADPRAVVPVELTTLHAYWLELYTQVRHCVHVIFDGWGGDV